MLTGLILPSDASATPSQDIALVRACADLGVDTAWVGERRNDATLPRLAALAAATEGVALGGGLLPLTGEGTSDLGETLTTLGLIARGRVRIGFDLPAALAGPSTPPWLARLDSAAATVRAVAGPVVAAVADRAGAMLAGPRVDRLVLRGADPALAADVVATASVAQDSCEVDVWLDLATDEPHGEAHLRAAVAQRLGVPGCLGHEIIRDVARRSSSPTLRGDVEAAFARGRLDEAAQLIPAEVIARTTLRSDDLAERVESYREAGVDRLTVRILGSGDHHAALRTFAGAVG